ncbi:hypothetical protein [Aquimarina algiphila]|uniref:DUF3078 domain-containing protein n=1 Tax=Aquimarina algiphila TaxID=2047982 RepID=A0A554VBS6_9FLAO|nr:hypothetical protein [Aquimarina algiphila]TSE04004.1 hypothetical protein FOF46_27845 [Aquimarina algiphila]
MKSQKLILLITFYIYHFITTAQENKGSFFNQVTLRKSFQSKNDKAEPAIITYSNPKEKEASWLINGAVGINVLPKTKKVLTLSPYIEYHRNTLIDKEQDNFQTGLALEWQTSDISTNGWTPVLISSIKYNNDNIKDISSFQGNIYFTPLFKGKALEAKYFWLPNTTVNFGKLFQFVYTPYLGLENENRISTEENIDEGNIYRGYFRISSNILLFPINEKLKNRFEFNVDWQYRYNFSENIQSLNTSEHQYFTTSFNYIFFKTDDDKKSAKIGLDYVNGENPTKNFEEQSFYAISLKIKL